MLKKFIKSQPPARLIATGFGTVILSLPGFPAQLRYFERELHGLNFKKGTSVDMKGESKRNVRCIRSLRKAVQGSGRRHHLR